MELMQANNGQLKTEQQTRRLVQQLGGKKRAADQIDSGQIVIDGAELRNSRKLILKPVQSARPATVEN